MPQDPILVRQDVVEKTTSGGNDRVLLTKYEAPSNADGDPAHDPFKEKDAEVAATMMRWLEEKYPGHHWGTVADLAQGIVKFNSPILMGFDKWWVVNLRTHDIVEGMRAGAGQILERYGLRRGRFNLTEFLEARAQHSRLVLPSREVPE